MALTHYVQAGSDGSLAATAACGMASGGLAHDVAVRDGVEWCASCRQHVRALEQDWSSYESQCF